MLSALVLQDMGGGGGAGIVGILVMLIELAIAVVFIAGMWKLFVKAGEPGWAAIVPIYSAIVLLKIAGKPIWWIILLCIPVVGAVLVGMAIAEKFGKSSAFGIVACGLFGIGYLMIGFGSAQYQGAPALAR